MDDATTIVNLMDYEIAKYLKEGVIPIAVLKVEFNVGFYYIVFSFYY